MKQSTVERTARADRLARLFPGVTARPSRSRRWLLPLILSLPTLVAVFYYCLVADDRFVSEARFLVRTASKPANELGGMGALLQMAGLSRSQDDAYAVRDFLTSRDALQQLRGQLDLSRIYEHSDADLLLRYPSPLYPPTSEGLYRFLRQRLSVVVDPDSGLTTLRVEAFNAADANRVAKTLLELGEHLVNQLNERIRVDTIRVAEEEVRQAQERRIAAEVAVTAFRNGVLMLDPNKNAAMVLQVIGRLAAEEAEVKAEIATIRATAPTSPQLSPLLQQAAALGAQMDTQRARMGSSSDGLADKIADYERLVLEQDFATRMLAEGMNALETARTEARRQALFVERVVEPGTPDEAAQPRRVIMIVTIFGFNVLGVGLLWLLGTGLKEHAAAAALRNGLR